MKKSANDELVFLPLGGSNEIGMNLNCYGYGPEHNRQWLIADVGVTFGDPSTPGIDVIVPDPSFLEGEKIRGIVLTHAHEDHIGALGWLWTRMKAPLYATPFTAFLIREKLREAGILNQVKIHEVPLNGTIDLDPFKVTMITMTHSIAEPNGLAIRTPLGTVFHTGDWKIDDGPVVGEVTDAKAITALGDEGILAMVCDSTNVFSEGYAGSETGVAEELDTLIGSLKHGRIAVGCFASNVARMDSVIRAAEKHGRRIFLAGRSMNRITAAAKHVGMLSDVKKFLSDEEARVWPADEILYLCTGSQGEQNAALARVASGTHPTVKLGRGTIASSRPGSSPAMSWASAVCRTVSPSAACASTPRRTTPASTSRATPAVKSCARCTAGPARRSRSRPTACAATSPSMPCWRARWACPSPSRPATAIWSVWPPGRRSSSTRSRTAACSSTAACWCPNRARPCANAATPRPTA